MNSLSVVLEVILIAICIFSYAEVGGASDWKYFGSGEEGIFWWYDAQGLVHQPNRIIQVWVKKVKAPEIKEMVERGTTVRLSELEQITSGKDYERSFMEIDCVEKTVIILQRYNYDSKGALKSGESKSGIKQKIPEQSVAESLHKAICK